MCAYYMAIGMPREEYWHGNPYAVREYKEAHDMKIDMKNQELWLQGLYIYNAIAVVIGNAFGKARNEYPKEPFNIRANQESGEAEAERQREEIINNLAMFERKFNKNGNNNRRTAIKNNA